MRINVRRTRDAGDDLAGGGVENVKTLVGRTGRPLSSYEYAVAEEKRLA
jgi:hypothetical protein